MALNGLIYLQEEIRIKIAMLGKLLPDMEKSKVDVHLYLDNTFLCSEYEELVQ